CSFRITSFSDTITSCEATFGSEKNNSLSRLSGCCSGVSVGFSVDVLSGSVIWATTNCVAVKKTIRDRSDFNANLKFRLCVSDRLHFERVLRSGLCLFEPVSRQFWCRIYRSDLREVSG